MAKEPGKAKGKGKGKGKAKAKKLRLKLKLKLKLRMRLRMKAQRKTGTTGESWTRSIALSLQSRRGPEILVPVPVGGKGSAESGCAVGPPWHQRRQDHGHREKRRQPVKLQPREEWAGSLRRPSQFS
eukprot:TRINITY_DN32705_c0_g1_i2.p5 TRINITY_DN32705_c0_g1~~TRINITY_DN32705_c0_g1_i2.p5  ORF type:complete len:127 (+),score=7.12 TRINITY_DN32705_c0_g1_i2:398-778(+)